jgi:O-antigen ligase
MSKVLKERSILLAAVGYFCAAVFHVPDNYFEHVFDRTAPLQFLTLALLASIFAIVIALNPSRFNFSKKARYGLFALAVFGLISVALSGNPIGSLFGDSGRFAGFLSLAALVIVAIFHSQFKIQAFRKLLLFYIATVEVVALLGIIQHFKWLTFPGAGGVSSTLGNTDFFAAYLGTTFPLIFLLVINGSRKVSIFLGGAALLNITAIYFAGPLQAYVDIAITVFGIAIYLVRKKIHRFQWTLNARTFLGTVGIIIWAEFIFLMPFLGNMVPVLGNDIQVQIRGNFWIAGIKQFLAHPFFGVGPDQYGNYYEQYRTLSDLKNYPDILSNDAHSASVQTLATLGIFGTLALIFLLTLLVRSILIIWDGRVIDRRILFAFSLFIFTYLTNSFVSPIILVNKYLFWAVGGFLVGQVYRNRKKISPRALNIRVAALTSSSVLVVASLLFIQGQWNYMTHIEKYAANNQAIIDYTPSPVLPCFMYFDAEALMLNNQGNQVVLDLASKELASNPRCVSANLVFAKYAVATGDIESLKKYAYQLHEIAPARGKSIEYGMYYATKVADQSLFDAISKIMKELNLIYVPGTTS